MNSKPMFLSVLASFFLVFTSFSMQREEPIEPMTEIKNWFDIMPFANRIIAYTTSSYYFGNEKGYPLNANSRLKYGYINDSVDRWQGGEQGYNLTQLLNPTDVAGNKALINSKLNNAGLAMRFANIYELNQIREAIQAGKAQFEYMFDKPRALKLLRESEQNLGH